ncbi:hypothetical protein Dimus_009000 [Dionaea muscipula]
MGNCLFGGEGGGGSELEPLNLIQVVTCNGGIMEFHPPVTAGCILNEFSAGHNLYQGGGRRLDKNVEGSLCKPLQHDEQLLPGKSYWLLPWASQSQLVAGDGGGGRSHVRSKSAAPIMMTTTTGNNINSYMPVVMPVVATTAAMSAPAPYRMSLQESESHLLKRSYTEVFSRSRNMIRRKQNKRRGGVWKVKLVISTERLVDILSQEDRTQELIDHVRTVANCRGVSLSSSSSSSIVVGTADQLSCSVSDRSIAASSSTIHE